MEIYCWVGAPHLISVPSKLTVQFGLFYPCYPYTGLAKPGIKPRTMRFVDECATDCNIQLKQNPFNIVDRNCPSLGLRHNREHSINNEEYWSYSAISPSFQKYSYIMKIHYIKNAVFLLHLTDVPKLEHCIYLSNNVLHRIQIKKPDSICWWWYPGQGNVAIWKRQRRSCRKNNENSTSTQVKILIHFDASRLSVATAKPSSKSIIDLGRVVENIAWEIETSFIGVFTSSKIKVSNCFST